MAENVGAIYYTVEADTSKLLNAVQPVEKSMRALEGAMGKADSSATKMATSATKAGNSLKSTGAAVRGLGQGVNTLTGSVSTLGGGMGSLSDAANDTRFKLTQTAEAVKSMGNESSNASNVMGRLTGVLAGLATAATVKKMVDMATHYKTISENLKTATTSIYEYNLAQEAMLRLGNTVGRSIEDLYGGYILASQQVKRLGYSTNETVQIIESLGYALAKSGATAAQNKRAMTILANASIQGNMNLLQYRDLLRAIPSMMDDMAATLGKTTKELYAMMEAGELSSKVLTDTLLNGFDANKEAAGAMATTIEGAFQALSNSLTTFVGEADQASGSTKIMADAIMLLADNVDVVANLLLVAGAGAIARYIAQLGASAIASGKAALDARIHAQEELARARANDAAARSALTSANSNNTLAASHANASRAAGVHAAASRALSASVNATRNSMAMLVGVLGGPVGVISLLASAATAFVLFGNNSDSARSKVDGLRDSVERLTEANIKKMGVDEAINELSELQEKIEAVDKRMKRLSEGIQYSNKPGNEITYDDVKDATPSDGAMYRLKRAMEKERAEFAKLEKDREDAVNRMEALQKRIDGVFEAPQPEGDGHSEGYAEALRAQRQRIEMMKVEGVEAAKLAIEHKYADTLRKDEIETLKELVEQEYELQKAKDAVAQSEADSDTVSRYISNLEKQIELSKLSGESQVRQRVQQDLQGIATQAQIEKAQELAVAQYNLQQATKAVTVATTKNTEVDQEALKAQREKEDGIKANIQVINDLVEEVSNLTEKTREQAQSAAVARLNEYATPEQIAAVKELSAALWDVAMAEKQKELLAKFDPMAEAAFKYQGELDQLQEMLDQKTIMEDQYLMYREQKEAEYEAKIAELAEARFRNQTKWHDMMMSNLETLANGTSNAITGLITGMNSAEDAARQVASSIVGNVVDAVVKMGLQWVKSAVIAQGAQASAAATSMTTGAAVSAAWAPAAAMVSLATMGANSAAANAGIATTMGMTKALSVVGGRQYGGPVDAGGMYRVNEDGKPEILNLSNGRQYIIPNQRGEVISNKNALAGGGGGANISINIVNNTPSNITASRREDPTGDRDAIIDIIVEDLNRDGRASAAMKSRFGLSSHGR